LLQSLPIREGEEKHLINYDLDRRPIYEMIKTLSALSILERDAAVAEAEKEINELNGIVEDANHRTALVE